MNIQLRHLLNIAKSKLVGNSVIKSAIPENRIIDAPGYYCLKKSIIIKDEPFGILIKSDSVVLDFCGYELITENVESQNFGIHLSNANDTTIKNAKIRGFYYGIIGTGDNITIENSHFSKIKYIGISLTGNKATIYNNVICDMDFFHKKDESERYLIGMNIAVNSSLIWKNIFLNEDLPSSEINPKVEYVGLLLAADTKSAILCENKFKNSASNREKTYAIWLGSGSSASIINNELSNHIYDFAIHDAVANIANNKTDNISEVIDIINELK